MPRPTGPTNPNTKKLIAEMRKVKDYKDLAKALGKSSRRRAEVMVSDINEMKDDKIATAAKILSNGNIERAVTVYAWRYTEEAVKKIEAAGGKALSLNDLLESRETVKIV